MEGRMTHGYSVKEMDDGTFIAERFLINSQTFEIKITNSGPPRNTSKEAWDDTKAIRKEKGE
jgi:hypothetical protein